MPQIHTRTFARAVIAALGLAACSNPSTAGRTSTALTVDLGREKAFRDEFASAFILGFQSEGLTITNDQANCMASGVLNEFGIDGLAQLMRDSEGAMLDDPAAQARGKEVILGCLPPGVAAAVAKSNG